jgi:hypothetical protein
MILRMNYLIFPIPFPTFFSSSLIGSKTIRIKCFTGLVMSEQSVRHIRRAGTRLWECADGRTERQIKGFSQWKLKVKNEGNEFEMTLEA